MGPATDGGPLRPVSCEPGRTANASHQVCTTLRRSRRSLSQRKDDLAGEPVVRGRRGDLLKILVWDGQGLILVAKRLEKGRFVWPQARDGVVSLTAAQLSMLFEGIDWRMPAWTARPQATV